MGKQDPKSSAIHRARRCYTLMLMEFDERENAPALTREQLELMRFYKDQIKKIDSVIKIIVQINNPKSDMSLTFDRLDKKFENEMIDQIMKGLGELSDTKTIETK